MYTNMHNIIKGFLDHFAMSLLDCKASPGQIGEAPEALNTLESPVPRNTVGSLVGSLAWKAPKHHMDPLEIRCFPTFSWPNRWLEHL